MLCITILGDSVSVDRRSCIIQDPKEDWQQESSPMNARCTLDLTSISPVQHLQMEAVVFPSQESMVCKPCSVQVGWKGEEGQTLQYIDYDLLVCEVEEGPVNKRAWVHWEQVWAPRVVHFSAT